MSAFPSLYEIFAPAVNAESPSTTVAPTLAPQVSEPINELTHEQRMDDLQRVRSALPNHNNVALDPYETSPNVFAAWFREYTAMNPVDRLDLSGAGLHHFPPEACCLNVRALGLSDNQLTSLPMEIAEMTHLEELHLGNNPWTDFPYEIEALPNLRTTLL